MIETEVCPACRRNIPCVHMTNHHVIPQSKGGTTDDTIRLCETCHNALHYVIPIDNIQHYPTVKQLENHWLYGTYLQWIREKKHSAMYKIKKTLRFWLPRGLLKYKKKLNKITA